MADYLKIPEVARRLDVSEPTVRRMVKSGKLPSVFVGGAYRVSEEDLEAYLENARVIPGKASAPPGPQQSFNGLLEDERREAVYRPWLEFANRYAGRWEQRIAEGAFDVGAVYEFIGTLEDLGPVLSRLGLLEKQEQPEFPGTYGPIMGEAIERLMSLLTPLAKAGHAQLEDSELAQLRRKRESLEQWGRAASG